MVSEYFKNLYSKKLEIPKEMGTFLDAFGLFKLNKKDKPPNRCKTSNEIEAVIVYQQRKAQDLMDSLLNYTRSLAKISTNAPQTIP
jgi:hypothetical protein